MRFGYRRVHVLLRREGWEINQKKTYRIYKELALNLRIKPRLRLQRKQPAPLAVPTAANQVWSMDFMSDALADGRRLRLLNVIDDFNREALAMDVALSIPSEQVIRYLERTIEQRGKPKEIRVDNGPEYIFDSLEQAELLVTQWQWQYNNVRPNMAIGGVPPRLKAA